MKLPLDISSVLEFEDTIARAAFRDEFRCWLADALPTGWRAAQMQGDRGRMRAYRKVWDEVAWHQTMGEAGYLAVHWPTEYGGRGLSLAEHFAVQDEVARAGVPMMGLAILAVGLCGPTIMEWGTDEQKNVYLPGIASGRDIWCQLFSEPGAGSDLASVTTRADRRSDGGFAVRGQKVWTSLAQHARYGMLLARTDAAADKHHGLSWMIASLRDDEAHPRPGYTIRPLRMITGEAHFNEVFLDGLLVGQDEVLGPVDAGWRVVRTTLLNERMAISGASFDQGDNLADILRAVTERGIGTDPYVRRALAGLFVDQSIRDILAHRSLERKLAGAPPGPEESINKILMARFNQARTELNLDLAGIEGVVVDHDGPQPSADLHFGYLRARANSIEGGTVEVLRNVIAERLLGLPKSL
ncbi:acyl-CoA dehydrogenase family protein [Mycolicibacterium sphagni]|uniref:Acyl-CoA dehydrogenase n=1 Tax=Mycolicibacterium sphagni TaxID=1786 RepID=A0A255D9X1_9MYCO|nr:acyl-CoA dehydrogenase family protein [Mycolicibacterium sphagni]OYN76166.1 hypothetical protein CG716_22715 [Mycolicibacterium sphagni]